MGTRRSVIPRLRARWQFAPKRDVLVLLVLLFVLALTYSYVR